jgi:hypothetical protein
MAADNALSQIEMEAVRVVIEGIKNSGNTPQTSVANFDALGIRIMAVIIEDGLEFSGLGIYGGGRMLATNIANLYDPPVLTAAMISALVTALGTGAGGLASLQTATKAQTGLFAALMNAILNQAGIGSSVTINTWVLDMQTKFNALTGLT